MTLDARIAITAVALYTGLVLVYLPGEEYVRALGGAAVVFGGVTLLAHRMGRGTIPGLSVIGVAAVAVAVLVMPTLPAMGGRHPAAVPIGFIGVQAAIILWAALRWQPPPPRFVRARTSLGQAWFAGAIMALVLSLIAALLLGVGLLTGERYGAGALLVFPAYFVGMLGAATVYWLLQRLTHLAVGRYLIGVLGGICVYGAMGPVVAILDGNPVDPRFILVLASIIGGVVGPAIALDRSQDVAAT